MLKSLCKIAIISVTLLSQGTSYAASSQNINALAQSFMQQYNIPGMSIAVIKQNQITTYNYGYANELKKIPTSNNTIYTIASFSKTFTATLAAIASVQGKLNLDASFNQYIPELQGSKNLAPITTSMLLGHVASLPFNFTPSPASYAEGLADLQQFQPAYLPGTQFRYSNVGIGIVGYALQDIYGTSYEQLLANEINKPLGMTSTYLNVPANKQQYIALGHDEQGNAQTYDSSIEVWFAAASLKSTISDMAKYLNAQINSSSLSDTELAQAINVVHQNKYCFANKLTCGQLAWQAHIMSQLDNDSDDTFYSVDANGNFVFSTQAIINNPNFPKDYFIDKTGSGYGMSSYMAYIPNKKVGVVILLNKAYVTNKDLADQKIKLGRTILKSLV